MTKSELIQRLAEQNPRLYERDVERIVATIFDEISSALANGDRVGGSVGHGGKSCSKIWKDTIMPVPHLRGQANTATGGRIKSDQARPSFGFLLDDQSLRKQWSTCD